MKNRYLLPVLTGLMCLGCSKPELEPSPLPTAPNPLPTAPTPLPTAPDSFSTIFNTVEGKYRFTKVKTHRYINAGGPVVTDSTQACDIPVIVKRVGGTKFIELTMGLVNPVTTGGKLDTTTVNTSQYYFSADMGTVGYSMSFKVGTDSIKYYEFFRGTGGGWSSMYYGKKQ